MRERFAVSLGYGEGSNRCSRHWKSKYAKATDVICRPSFLTIPG
jgi:hypothetical protein